jgi:hypothetical protein
VVYG